MQWDYQLWLYVPCSISLKAWIHKFKPLHNSLPSKLIWKCLVLLVHHFWLLQDPYRKLTRCFDCLNQILCYTSKYCMKTNKTANIQSWTRSVSPFWNMMDCGDQQHLLIMMTEILIHTALRFLQNRCTVENSELLYTHNFWETQCWFSIYLSLTMEFAGAIYFQFQTLLNDLMYDVI